MTVYDLYLEAISNLDSKILQGDSDTASQQRQNKAEQERLNADFNGKTDQLQARARKSAEDYTHTKQQLEARNLAELRVRLPDRVRPSQETSLSVAQALALQDKAQQELMQAISAYRAGTKNDAAAANSALAALEARRKALQNQEKQEEPPVPLPTPPPVVTPERPKEKKSPIGLFVALGLFAVGLIGGVVSGYIVAGLIAGVVLAAIALIVYSHKGGGKLFSACFTSDTKHVHPNSRARHNY